VFNLEKCHRKRQGNRSGEDLRYILLPDQESWSPCSDQ